MLPLVFVALIALVSTRFSIETTPLASSITALSVGKAQNMVLLPVDKSTAEPLLELASTVVLAIVLPLLTVPSPTSKSELLLSTIA